MWLNFFFFFFASGSLLVLHHWYLLRNNRLGNHLIPLYAYGKTIEKKEANNNKQGKKPETSNIISFFLTLVPKYYFQYFYDFAIVLNISLLIVIPALFWLEMESLVTYPMSILFSHFPSSLVLHNSSVFWVVFLLEFLQILRRCYECHFVSVFAPNSMITVAHAVIGFAYYLAVSNALINLRLTNTSSLNIINLIGVVIFTMGFILQYNSHCILANLRKRKRPSDKKEMIMTTDHLIPYGGGFTFVSCPHYFGEIVIYLGIFVTSGFDFSFGCILFNVICSHIMMAEQSHSWYLKTFKESYPKNRKMLIPFLL